MTRSENRTIDHTVTLLESINCNQKKNEKFKYQDGIPCAVIRIIVLVVQG